MAAALLSALLAESGLDARLDGACEEAVAVPAAPRLLDDPAAPGRLYAEAFATPDWADELDAMRRVLRVPAPAPTGLRLVAGDGGQGAPVLEAAPAD